MEPGARAAAGERVAVEEHDPGDLPRLGGGGRHRDGRSKGVAHQHRAAEAEAAVEALDEPGPVARA